MIREIFSIHFEEDKDGNISCHAEGQPQNEKEYMAIKKGLFNYNLQFCEICHKNRFYPPEITKVFDKALYDLEDER